MIYFFSIKLFLGLNQYLLKSIASIDIGSFLCLADIQQKIQIYLILFPFHSASSTLYIKIYWYFFMFLIYIFHTSINICIQDMQ